MSRLVRKKRNDIWFDTYLQTRDDFTEELKRIWFLNDVELGFILNDLDDLILTMLYKPMHLNFTAKREIIGFVNTAIEVYKKEARFTRESILSKIEKVQKATFEFGSFLMEIENQQRLKYYRFDVYQLVIPFRVDIYRLKDSKQIASLSIEFDDNSYQMNLINDLVKEYHFQVTQKAGEQVLLEINHIASLFGVEMEHHRCIEGKPMTVKKEFMAYIFIDCLDLTHIAASHPKN